MLNQRGNAVLIIQIIIGVVIVGMVGLYFYKNNQTEISSTITNQDNNTENVNEETSSELGKAIVPTEGDPGIYNGNFETIILTEDDLPTVYGPYEKNTLYEVGETNSNSALYGNITRYNPQQLISASTDSAGFTLGMTLTTFEDTEKATRDHNISVGVAPIGKDDPNTIEGSFVNIGDANYYITTPHVNEYDSNYNSTHWNVYILESNMTVSLRIYTPTTYSNNDLEDLLGKWQNKLSNYQPISG